MKKALVISIFFITLSSIGQNTNSIFALLEDEKYLKNDVFIGASLNHFQLNGPIENIFLSEFRYLTPANAFKQTRIHPKPNVWKWDKCNDFLEFANKHKLTLRIHGPISPQASKWAKDDSRTKEELKSVMEDYFTALCKRINNENTVRWMDVVNETVLRDGRWFKEKPGISNWENPWTQIGLTAEEIPIYILRAFEIATQHAPNVKLVYNQNGGMEKIMWDKVISTIKLLKSKGLRVDAIGWQAHLRYDKFSDDDLNQLSSLIDWAHENNMEFHITELNLWVKEENFDKKEVKNWQADTYSEIYELALSKKQNGPVVINHWGLLDRKGNNQLNKNILSLYDNQFNPNLALERLRNVLENQK